jgi:hypothetical protein
MRASGATDSVTIVGYWKASRGGSARVARGGREHQRSPEPEQLIVGWIDREVKDFPPDPLEPPELFQLNRCGVQVE